MAVLARIHRRTLPSLLEFERQIVDRLSLDVERRSRKLAQRRAIERFARSHALWYESLFDERFLRTLPDDFFKRSAASVARSWAAQFPFLREESRARDVERLEPVAREFLEIRAEEERRLTP